MWPDNCKSTEIVIKGILKLVAALHSKSRFLWLGIYYGATIKSPGRGGGVGAVVFQYYIQKKKSLTVFKLERRLLQYCIIFSIFYLWK